MKFSFGDTVEIQHSSHFSFYGCQNFVFRCGHNPLQVLDSIMRSFFILSIINQTVLRIVRTQALQKNLLPVSNAFSCYPEVVFFTNSLKQYLCRLKVVPDEAPLRQDSLRERFTEATCEISCARFRARVRPNRAQD